MSPVSFSSPCTYTYILVIIALALIFYLFFYTPHILICTVLCDYLKPLHTYGTYVPKFYFHIAPSPHYTYTYRSSSLHVHVFIVNTTLLPIYNNRHAPVAYTSVFERRQISSTACHLPPAYATISRNNSWHVKWLYRENISTTRAAAAAARTHNLQNGNPGIYPTQLKISETRNMFTYRFRNFKTAFYRAWIIQENMVCLTKPWTHLAVVSPYLNI